MPTEFIINDKRTSFRLDVNVNIAFNVLTQNNYDICKDVIKSGFDVCKWDTQIDDIKKNLEKGMSVIKKKINDDPEYNEIIKKMDDSIAALEVRGHVFTSTDILNFNKFNNQTVNLSEGGIKFTSNVHINKGSKLIVSIELLPGHKKILAFATAHYVDEKQDNNEIKGLFGESNLSGIEGEAEHKNQYVVKATLDFLNLDGKEILKEYLEKSLTN